MFKAIFCNSKNQDLLKKLLEKCLKEKLEIIHVEKPEIIKENIYVKNKTLDVLVKAKDKLINIEVNSGFYDGLHRRNSAYIFNQYSTSTKVGEDYLNMPNIIQINFTWNLNKTYPILGKYKLNDINTRKEFVDNLIIFEYNIDEIKREQANNEYAFLAILDADEKELKKVERGDEFMEKYKKEIERLNEDHEFVEFLTQEEDNQKRFNTLVHIAHNEGLATGEKAGLEKGSKQKAKEIAKSMLKEKIDIDLISKVTGFTKAEIETFK